MAEHAGKLMTFDEFLAWDDGTDQRFELIDGVITAMTAPGPEHRIIVANAASEIRSRLRRRPPCRPENEAAIRIDPFVCWQADIAVTCGPLSRDVLDPLLIVEVLSPSTRANDLDRKLADYKALPSVLEIWLIDSERSNGGAVRWVQVWWREEEGWHVRDHVGGAAFVSRVVEAEIPLDELYLNSGL
jgi:Uma2 family endonuclease